MFLGDKKIVELQKTHRFIDGDDFDEKRIKSGAYELSLGREVFVTDAKHRKVEILSETNRGIDINPGQFALLLTKEKVHIPKDKIAFISIKAGEKLKGLVNVSGFHVDPGFHDHLLFSVYNAGPSLITLSYGEPYFPMWLAQLDEELSDDEAYNKDNEHFGKLSHIPPRYLEKLKQGELASPNVLLDRMSSNDTKLERWLWAVGIAITISGAFLVKLYTDKSNVKEAYEAGFKERTVRDEVRSTLNQSMIDSIVNFKIDSILKRKVPNDTTRHE
jgi:deoxycytidine triphosphate deaminase